MTLFMRPKFSATQTTIMCVFKKLIIFHTIRHIFIRYSYIIPILSHVMVNNGNYARSSTRPITFRNSIIILLLNIIKLSVNIIM